MTALSPARVGWCPGALRPMATGDGLVLRVKPRAGVLTLAQGRVIADCARRFGNGAIDFTGRANLQIRGVSDDTFAAAIAALAQVGLLDNDADGEAIRNVVASPLAGLEPEAAQDIRPIVAALETALVSDRALSGLPAKWSVVVDGGGALHLAGVAADIRFEAAADGSMQVGLADDPTRARCRPDEVPAVAVRLSRMALEPEPGRMAEPCRMDTLVRAAGAASLLAHAGLPSIADIAPARPAVRLPDVVGTHRLGHGVRVGAAAAFGGLDARDLMRCADAADAVGATALRLTPWRTIIIAGLTPAAAARFNTALATSALITDPNDPRLRIAACSGAPACRRGTTPVRHDAEALAALVTAMPEAESIALHVSGCTKGCAHGHPAPWTLVGHDGLYDVVRNGKAGDAPLAVALSFQDAASWLSRMLGEGRH